MIDIKKLEQLSCLKMQEKDKEKIIQSLSGIFDMMHQLDNVEIEESIKEPMKELTYLEKDSFSKDFIFSKIEQVEGLHIEEQYFLAPKVIKK